MAVAGSPIVSVAGVNHYFGDRDMRRQILFDVQLDLNPGEIIILTGPSGSGKTTLLTLVGALRALQEGSLRVLGRELRGLSREELVNVRKGIGFIFQAHNLFDSLTAQQNVTMAVELRPEDPKDKRQLASDMLGRVGLAQRVGYKPQSLSGGQRQRVAVARALVNRPKLVLADEPTAALDKESGRTVIELFQEMAAQDGCAVLLVTHDSRILDAADRIVNMVDGRVVSDVAVKRSLEICEFLARIHLFSGQSPGQLTEVAEKMRVEHFSAGSVIFREGDAGDRFYLIRSGSVDVTVAGVTGPKLVKTLRTGECFGETALIEDQPRNATIQVAEDVDLYWLNKEAFTAALSRSKSLRDQLRELLLQRT